jgi:general secretion pathway protein J
MTRSVENCANPCESCPQAGFTVVELLISLTILTLILAFIPGTLRVGQRIWEVDQSLERREGLASFRRYVEQRLAEAMPIYWRGREGGTLMEFTGEPDRLAFVAPAAAGPGGGGLYRFELTREQGGGDEQRLLLRQSLYRIHDAGNARDDHAWPPQAAVAEQRSPMGVGRLGLRYFGAAEPPKPPQWQTQWPRRDSMPDLVEISLTPADRLAKTEQTIVQLRLGSAR